MKLPPSTFSFLLGLCCVLQSQLVMPVDRELLEIDIYFLYLIKPPQHIFLPFPFCIKLCCIAPTGEEAARNRRSDEARWENYIKLLSPLLMTYPTTTKTVDIS